jgi:hypothetical protein
LVADLNERTARQALARQRGRKSDAGSNAGAHRRLTFILI